VRLRALAHFPNADNSTEKLERVMAQRLLSARAARDERFSTTTHRARTMPSTSHPLSRPVDASSSTNTLSLILRRLQTSSYLPLRLIHCSAEGPRVVLRGRVPSYYLKQLAQTLAGQCIGVPSVDNRLEVA
jgi:hypothetical protein